MSFLFVFPKVCKNIECFPLERTNNFHREREREMSFYALSKEFLMLRSSYILVVGRLVLLVLKEKWQ